ncbi:MAG: hypothetical protein ACE5JH_09370 [Acidobacteriota bacterium]
MAVSDRHSPVGGGRRLDLWVGAALFLGVLLLFGGRAAARYRPLSYLVGDCPYYASTAVSLLYDGDLDLRNQLRGGLEVHGRQIALGRDGAWYPKHPVLMPLAAVPFLHVFGMPGLLVFNLLVLGLLAVVMMRLARPAAGAVPAAAASLLLLLGTFLRRYDYNFSPDLFATLILAAGLLALARGHDGGGGLLLGLAAAAKLTHLFLVPVGWAFSLWSRGRRGLVRCAAGTAGPIIALACLNWTLFGSPFTTPYDRNVAIGGYGIVTLSHRGLFDQNPLAGLVAEMIDPLHGLLPTSPVLFLVLPGFVLLLRRRPAEAVLHLVIGEFLLLLFGTYRYWATSHYGNRFLMPVVAVAAPSVALTLEWLTRRLRPGRRPCGEPNPPHAGTAP